MSERIDVEKVISENKMVIVEFSAGGCTPCIAIREKVEKWVSEKNSIEFLYLPVDSYAREASEYQVFSGPTLILFVEGKPTLRSSGYFSLDEFFSKTERYISLIQ